MEKIKNPELKLKFFEETRCIFNPDIERGIVTESYIEWLESKVLSSHKAKPLEWRKGAGNSINADCPRGQFCIYFDDGYSYQLFDEDDYPITDAEGAYSLAEAKQLCQEWLQEMVDKAMRFVEV